MVRRFEEGAEYNTYLVMFQGKPAGRLRFFVLDAESARQAVNHILDEFNPYIINGVWVPCPEVSGQFHHNP